MGQVLTPEQMPDAVLATLDKLNRGKWIGQMTDLQEHVGFNELAKKRREQATSGRGIRVRYVTDHNHTARHTGLFSEQNFSRDDAIVEGVVRWTWSEATLVFDRREEQLNSGPEEVVDLVQIEQARALTSLIELCEEDIWGVPRSESDNDTPFGVEYWITKNATPGFNGGNPAGFTAGRAGISSDNYARHKNFTGAYDDFLDQDQTGLIYLMEEGAMKTNWKAAAPEPGMGRAGMGKMIGCNFETHIGLKNVAKQNNDSLGYDLSTTMPVFRGTPITYVPYFDSKTDNPLYMIDLNHFYAKFLKNWYMNKTMIKQLPNQAHCFGVLMTMGWNIVCDDLRRQAVFHKPA